MAFAFMEPWNSKLAARVVPRLCVYGDRDLSAQAPAVSKYKYLRGDSGLWMLCWSLVSSAMKSTNFVYKVGPCELQIDRRYSNKNPVR